MTDVSQTLRVNADAINVILAEAGVPDSAYLAVKIANELDPPNNPHWDAERVACLYLALGSTNTETLTHEARRTVEMLQAALSIGLDRGARLAFGEMEPIADASEARIAEVYDKIVLARDKVRERGGNSDVFTLLQEAKYGLGGRTNVAGSIRSAREAARPASTIEPVVGDGGKT